MAFYMLEDLTLDKLNLCFKKAVELNHKYMGVIIKAGGIESEMIINSMINYPQKQAYYNLVYDNTLDHKHAEGIRITGVVSGSSFDELEDAFRVINSIK